MNLFRININLKTVNLQRSELLEDWKEKAESVITFI
jgi:hypothetical protein